jgi:Haem-binding domain
MKRKILIVVISALVVMQFFRIDMSQPTSDPKADFLAVTNVPDHIGTLIKTSCYNCHSNHTVYPWYSNVAPVSWWIKHHVNEAREHLNFSTWTSYKAKKAKHKLEEISEEAGEGEMPLYSYTLTHKDAILSVEDREELSMWFKQLYASTKGDMGSYD